MDRVSTNILEGFSKEYEITGLQEFKRFEWLTTFLALRRHYSKAVDLAPLVVGGGDDASIDGVAILINNTLVTDIDEAKDIIEKSDTLEVTFIFVQADRGERFDASKIGDFGFGVKDFFSEKPTLSRNDDLKRQAAISDLIIENSAKLKRPSCFLYYWTTGRWQEDKNLVARRDGVIGDLTSLNIFQRIEFLCLGADGLHTDYSRTKVAISRTFEFKSRVDLPAAEGVDQAYLGYAPYSEFRKLIVDDGGTEISSSIFFDNVRDWQEYNPVNSKIRDTLESESKNRFVLLNNGVTVVARDVGSVGSKFTLTDYQVVNGCQTSNVLFDQEENCDDTVCIPLRIIATKDENVKDQIIEATNSQTQVGAEQYFARLAFLRKLEDFFKAQPDPVTLYFERRDGQYDQTEVQKTRIVTTANLIRAFAAVYLEEPHRTTRGYSSLRNMVGDEIFGEQHQLSPYFAAAYALYLLETKFRTGAIDRKYKPARYEVLLALRLASAPDRPAASNSREVARQAEAFLAELSQPTKADELFEKALGAVDQATGGNFERDHVRTVGVTENILEYFGRPKLPSGAISPKTATKSEAASEEISEDAAVSCSDYADPASDLDALKS